ncbi:hypothetical protein [Sediminibacterium salmoneum]|uniref:hypothetical protein n=1 Tax=Sediminibacterium salmoneum TaxID=426421 RepID=UPI000479F63C|nr:hypothetical protein [Sediminibacterium salmoneum]
MNKCLLTLCFITALFTSKAQDGMKPRLGFYLGLASPKATEVFGQFYKSKGIQPRLTAEYNFLNLGYTKKMFVKVAAIAGLEPQNFRNQTTYLTNVTMTQKPLGARIYPFAFKDGFNPDDQKEIFKNAGFTNLFIIAGTWAISGLYVEGGISPGVKMKEEGYADVTRSPQFFGWGVSFTDFEDEDNKVKFKFNIGTRKYTWTNASNTTSQIKSFCMDFGIAVALN